MNILAFAKLNLNLHILPEKLSNGFFQVRFLNCQLDLHDALIFEEKKHDVEIICRNPLIPLGENNLIYKAAGLIKTILDRPDLGAKIILQKNIPVKAGLGGGSCDAAAAIKGLIKLWNIQLNQKQTFEIAEQLGKDVHYCLQGGICEVKGDGGEVIPLDSEMPEMYLIIITPDEKKPSTAWMYQRLDNKKIGQNLDKFERLKKALINKDQKEIIKNLFNDFEIAIIQSFPIIEKIKKDLKNAGADNSLLAGSGLSVVGFFAEEENRDQAFQKLKNSYKNIILTKTR